MKIRSVHAMVLLAVILLALGCKKSNTLAPTPTVPPTSTKTPAPKDLPTKLLKGGYLWHRNVVMTGVDGKDSSYTETIADYISVVNDTEIQMRSEIDYNSSKQYRYEYVSSNDSEVVYENSGTTLTYKKKRNLLIWGSGKFAHYGVPGATQKWGEVNKKRMDSNRHWYYKYQHLMLHYSRENTDTLANAVVLFKALLDSNTYLSGADSTGSVYEDFFYNAGPNEVYIETILIYKMKENKIDYIDYGRTGTYAYDMTEYTSL